MSKKHSDHKALLVSSEVESKYPKPFRIFNCFLNYKLIEAVKEMFSGERCWQKEDLHHVMRNIRNTVKSITQRANESLTRGIELLEGQVNELEESNEEEKHLKGRARLLELYHKRDSMLRQKSRVNWITLGDGDTRFFHQAIQKRRSHNNIIRLKWQGVLLTDPNRIRDAFYQHFSGFFSENFVKIFSLGSLGLQQLQDEGR